jgi:hypothetical protein
MTGERLLAVDLDGETRLVVVAEQVGATLIADDEVITRLGTVTDSIEQVSRDVLDALKRAAPTTASVEIGSSFAVEEGKLVALPGKAKGEASVTVTPCWSVPT